MVAEMAKIMLQTQNVAGQLGSWFRLSFVVVILSQIYKKMPPFISDAFAWTCKLQLNWSFQVFQARTAQ